MTTKRKGFRLSKMASLPTAYSGHGDMTALHLAAHEGYPDIISILLENGADVNFPTINNRTALFIACLKRHTESVRILVQHGCDLNLQSMENDEFKTPLMKAIERGEDEIVEILIDAGANVNLQDKFGMSALMMAAYYARTHAIRRLIQAGANLELARHNGGTAFTISVQNPPLTAKLLVLSGCFLGDAEIACLCDSAIYDLDMNEALWIIAQKENPNSLQQSCRLAVRKILGENAQRKIQYLPLPRRVQEFLRFSDLDELVLKDAVGAVS